MATWRERVDSARRRGRFEAIDHSQAKSWATCAVGEQRARCPEVILYYRPSSLRSSPILLGPVDYALEALGAIFYAAVTTDDFAQAEDVLNQIDDRVLVLKRTSLA